MVSADIDSAPVFNLCDAREKRFLYDLMQEDPDVMDDHPIPELRALLSALKRMWGGESVKELRVPPELMYYLVAYATYAHLIPFRIPQWFYEEVVNDERA